MRHLVSFISDDKEAEDPQLSALPAVQNGAVYQMPGGIEEWDSPVPSGILGTMWMTSVLHPDVYPFEEFTADARTSIRPSTAFQWMPRSSPSEVLSL